MVKCVVSGCPNRMVNVNRGIFNRPPKRFFNFPKDPARVKVWLAALRETDKQDSTEQQLICEDHFLPEDISSSGVSSDAIPIMPPCLDGPLSLASPWGAESSEEEEEEEEEDEEEQWETRGRANEPPPAPKPPAAVPPQQGPVRNVKNPSEPEKPSTSVMEKKETTESNQSKTFCRQDVSLGLLTRNFLKLLMAAPNDCVDLRDATVSLRTRKRRVYDITNVLNGIDLIQKDSANRIKWIGSCPISNFLWTGHKRIQKELMNLKLVEDTLDSLIKSCAQQLFEMTDDVENSASAYVTHEDISRLSDFQNETVVVVKAPEETKLEIPPPKEDNIQISLKAGKGPITVVTCEVGSGDAVASASGETKGGVFLTLEESRIKTGTLRTESCGPPSAVQSA